MLRRLARGLATAGIRGIGGGMNLLPLSPSPAREGTDGRGLGLPWASWLVAVLFIVLLLPKIDAGTLWHHDELLTANRSREILRRGDPFVVTVNFAPSVKKPPLQYWCCAALLCLWPHHPELALRLPTLLGGAACLLAAAWLARVYFPFQPALAAWSSLALACCGYLIHFSRVALLDTGAALFFTLALGGIHLARKDARWWWFVAAQCILGAWQKAPYGLAAWLLLLAIHRWLPAPRPDAADDQHHADHRHLPYALAVAVACSLAWWLIQLLRADHGLLATASKEQVGMFLRSHDITDQSDGPWMYGVWLVEGWTVLGLGAMAGTASVLFSRRDGGKLAGLGWVCAIFGVVMACLAYRAQRYLVVITPALAVLGVSWLQRQASHLPSAWRRWVLPAVVATALPVAAFQYWKAPPRSPDLLAAAHALALTARPDERLFVCTDAIQGFEAPAFVLFYADLGRPLEAVPFRDLEGSPDPNSPRRGICNASQWITLSRAQPWLKQVFSSGGWVLWST